MPVISSIIFLNNLQVDGRLAIREHHVDDHGIDYYVDYIANEGVDISTNLAASAVRINSDIVQLALDTTQAEIRANLLAIATLGSLAVPTFVSSTPSANIAALRSAYQSSSQTQAIFIGDFLNSLTDNQLKVAFGVANGQLANIRANFLIPAAAQAASIRNAVGG